MLRAVNGFTRSTAYVLLVSALMAACTESEQVNDDLRAVDAPGKSGPATEESADTIDLAQIAAETIELIQAIRGEIPAEEVVNFEQLFRVLPTKAADMPRVSREGRTNTIGLGLSGVEAVYEDGDRSATLAIVDLAPYRNLSDLLFVEWTRGEIDRQTHQGYERTRPYQFDENSWPAYEQVRLQDDHASCQIKVWVAQRFLVSIDGEGADEDLCRQARSDISFRRLERLAERPS